MRGRLASPRVSINMRADREGFSSTSCRSHRSETLMSSRIPEVSKEVTRLRSNTTFVATPAGGDVPLESMRPTRGRDHPRGRRFPHPSLEPIGAALRYAWVINGYPRRRSLTTSSDVDSGRPNRSEGQARSGRRQKLSPYSGSSTGSPHSGAPPPLTATCISGVSGVAPWKCHSSEPT